MCKTELYLPELVISENEHTEMYLEVGAPVRPLSDAKITAHWTCPVNGKQATSSVSEESFDRLGLKCSWNILPWHSTFQWSFRPADSVSAKLVNEMWSSSKNNLYTKSSFHLTCIDQCPSRRLLCQRNYKAVCIFIYVCRKLQSRTTSLEVIDRRHLLHHLHKNRRNKPTLLGAKQGFFFVFVLSFVTQILVLLIGHHKKHNLNSLIKIIF